MKVSKQTKLKLRLASLFAVVAVMMPQIIQFTQSAYMMSAWAEVAATETATTYFYKQLEAGNERTFYDTFMMMHQKGFLRQGNVSVKVTGLNYTAGEEQTLLNEMGAARDAFWLDHADLFYVDFDQLSLKIVDENGTPAVYVGTGRSDTYINKEFLNDDDTIDEEKIKNAINAVNSRVDAIVKEASTKTTTQGKVRAAHDAVIKAAKYTLEFDTKHPYSVRTVYGVFGLGQANNAGNAVCEGYARALKMILDRMGIVSILVRGVYMENGKPQEHMWLYVQDAGKWYAIDVTFDNGAEDKGQSDAAQHEYFWVGGDKMESHIETGVISTSNKEFEYPILEGDLSGAYTENTTTTCSIDDDDYDSYEEAVNDPNSCTSKQSNVVYEDATGLRIEYVGKEWIGGDIEGKDGEWSEKTYHISYKGMGYVEAAEKGDYIILNAWQYRENKETGKTDLLPTSWTYPTEVTDVYQKIYQDHYDEGYFSVKAEEYNAFQVGVTKIGFEGEPSEFNAYGVFFEGDNSDIFVISQDIETGLEVRGYPQPFVKKTNPAHTRAQTVGKTYHIVVEYDQEMELIKSDEPLDYELKLYDLVYGYRTPNQDEMKYEIKNIQLLDDKRTITYDFTPSKMWSLDETAYIVSFTNIQGIKSQLPPNPVEYVLFNKTTTCIFQLHSLNADLEVYGKPTLMDDFDVTELMKNNNLSETMNDEEWLEYLQKYGDLLKNRLSLVVSDTTSKENDVLEGLLTEHEKKDGRELDDKDGATHIQTYNITLSMCGKQLAELYEKDGQRVRLKLGFPEGYSYSAEDEGVTFKAYHYKDLGNGKYEIEEIPCTITEYGLIISVPAFSPFAIAALNKDEAKDAANENIIFAEDVVTLRSTTGGKIIDAADNKQLPATVPVDGEKELIAVADDGYAIEKLTVNGDTIAKATGKLRHNFTVKKGDSVVVSFVTTKKTEDIANPDTHEGYGPDENLIEDDWEWPEDEEGKDDPSTPTNPSDPSKPTDPKDPTDPSEPTDPKDPNEPTDPTEPSIKQGTTQKAATSDNKVSVDAVFGKDVAGATGIKVESKSLSSFAEVSKKYPGLKAVYDIFAIDKDSQPLAGGVKDNDITVTLKISKDVFGGKKYNTYKVVYINDKGETEEMTLVGEVSQGDEYYMITFKTTHLSYYGVVAYDEQKPTTTDPSKDKNNALTSTADGRVYIILAAISLLGILALAVTKKTA